MDAIRHFLLHNWMKLVLPLAVLVITLAIGSAVKRILLRVLRAWANRTNSQGAAFLTQALAGPFMLWVVILGIHLAVQSSQLPPEAMHWTAGTLKVLWVASFT